MNLHQFFLVLRARWKIAVATLLTVVLGTIAINLLLPKRYTATTTIVADVRAPDPVAGMITAGIVAPSYLPTQVDIINSDRVAQRVVKILGLERDPMLKEEWLHDTDGHGTLQGWLAALLQNNLNVKPSRDSNVIAIGFTSSEPASSAAVANAFAKAYIDTMIEMKVEPARQSAAWFAAQTRAAREALEKAQARISEYQQEKGLVSNDEHVDSETARLNDLTAQLTQVQGQTSDAMSRQRAAGSTDAFAEVNQNPVVVNLRTELAGAESRLQELSSKLGSSHPDHARLETTIASLRRQIANETGRVTRSFATARDVGMGKEGELRAAIAAQRAKLLELKNQRAELGVLMREGEVAQRAYDAVSQRYTQTSLESQSTQTNVVLLTPASEPHRPSSPQVLFNTLVALMVGAVLALIVAFMRELADRRVRSHEDLEFAIGLPMLARLEAPQAGSILRIAAPANLRIGSAVRSLKRPVRRLLGRGRMESKS